MTPIHYISKEYINIHHLITRTNVASVGSVFNDTRKVKVLSLPETIKEKNRLSFQVVREPLPFAHHLIIIQLLMMTK